MVALLYEELDSAALFDRLQLSVPVVFVRRAEYLWMVKAALVRGRRPLMRRAGRRSDQERPDGQPRFAGILSEGVRCRMLTRKSQTRSHWAISIPRYRVTAQVDGGVVAFCTASSKGSTSDLYAQGDRAQGLRREGGQQQDRGARHAVTRAHRARRQDRAKSHRLVAGRRGGAADAPAAAARKRRQAIPRSRAPRCGVALPPIGRGRGDRLTDPRRAHSDRLGVLLNSLGGYNLDETGLAPLGGSRAARRTPHLNRPSRRARFASLLRARSVVVIATPLAADLGICTAERRTSATRSAFPPVLSRKLPGGSAAGAGLGGRVNSASAAAGRPRPGRRRSSAVPGACRGLNSRPTDPMGRWIATSALAE